MLSEGAVDHDLHGLVTVRLLDPSPANNAAVGRQLGTVARSASGPADVTVRYVDRVERRGRLRLIGLNGSGFTDDAFFFARPRADGTALVEVPLDRIGARAELVCERRVGMVPMLVPILNLTMLAKGVLPLHASAAEWGGRGIVAAGWRTSGKTEALLAFMAHGARAVADEWVYVTPDRQLRGIPEPIRLQDWHFEQLPELRSKLERRQRTRLRAIAGSAALAGAAQRAVAPMRHVRRAAAAQAHVDVSPRRLFGDDGWIGAGRLDRLFLLVTGEAPEIRVEEAKGHEIAERMVHAHQHHRLGLLAAHLELRFAFPDRLSEIVEGAAELERRLLVAAFEGVPSHVVEHPHPMEIRRLFDAMQPFCE